MSSRDAILKAVKANKPAYIPLPEKVHFQKIGNASLLASFIENLTNIGASFLITDDWQPVKQYYAEQKQKGIEIVNAVKELENYNIDAYVNHSAAKLESVGIFFMHGSIGVAENGAIWLTEKNIGNRLLPFICENLVMVVYERDIVPNMHEVYNKVRVDEEGYSVFIAGPSKTADIEQSLVIGAHGPLSLHVFIIKNPEVGV